MSNEIVTQELNTLPTVATPADLLQMAVSQGADLDKMEKLMELQERWEANEAKKAYTKAMAAFNEESLYIKKTREAHNSKYAGLAETLDVVRPALQKHGLSHSWKTEQSEAGAITVKCCITHIMGHAECTSMSAAPDESGSKNNIQSIGSTQTYLQRYTLYAILGLASTDQDDDGGNVHYITAEQAVDLQSMVEEVGGDKARLLKGLKAESFEKIPESKYGQSLRLIEQKRSAK